MISLQKKILRPYIFLIVAIPLVIMGLFNVSIGYFAGLRAERDLAKVYVRLQESLQSHGAKVPPLVLLFRAKNFALATELLLFSPRGHLVQPGPLPDMSIDEATAGVAFAAVSKEEDGVVVSFMHKGQSYYAFKAGVQLKQKPTLAVYVTHKNSFASFVTTINILLVSISLLVVLISIVLSHRVALSLVKPIKDIIKRLENTDFHTVPVMVNPSHISHVTELNALSQEINHMTHRIYVHNQEQKSFLHNASHELRTPLMSIQGYAEGIEQKIFADNAQAARIIKEETKRLSTLVDELLTLSRIESAGKSKVFEPAALETLLQNHVQMLKGYALKQGKEIHLQLLSGAQAQVNEELFDQAVTNVVSNAIRFATKHITVRLSTTQGQAVIDVEDDGEGIAEEDFPYIFDKFYRGKRGHFGLGLSISASAVYVMGGTLEAKNGTSGAVFTLSLPLSPENTSPVLGA